MDEEQEAGNTEDDDEECPQCGGTGFIPGSIPGEDEAVCHACAAIYHLYMAETAVLPREVEGNPF